MDVTPRIFLLALCLLLILVPIAAAQQAADSVPAISDSATVTANPDTAHQESERSASTGTPGRQGRRSPGMWDFLLTGKFLAMLILALLGLAALFGRLASKPVRIGALLVAFALFGLDYIYPLHPSPMCAVTKLFMFKFSTGRWMPQFLSLFFTMIVLSLVGRKLFCGWVCPLGALQELINKLPFKWRRKTFSFVAFNTIRMSLLALFFLTFFMVRDQILTLAGEMEVNTGDRLVQAYANYNVYEPVNFFELLHWQIDTIFVIMGVVLLLASLWLYRPFCYGVCPIGALSWLLEQITPGRVRVDRKACTDCGICTEESPCPTIDKIVAGKSVVPDCTSCGECIPSCPEKAISYSYLPKR